MATQEEKTDVSYALFPISADFASIGGYVGQLKGRTTYGTSRLIKETLRTKNITFDEKEFRSHLERLLDTAIELVVNNGVNVRIDGYLLFRPVLKGHFKDKTSSFDPAKKHKVVLDVTILKDMKIDTSNWSLHNVTEGVVVKVDGVSSVGMADKDKLTLGLDILIVGEPLALDLEGGDSVSYTCSQDGSDDRTGTVTVVSSTNRGIICHWPSELGASTVGGTLTLTVHSRCGDPEAELQHKSTAAMTIVADDTPPTPTPTGDEPELERGYSEGEGHSDGQIYPFYAFILKGVNLTGAAVKIGYVESGTPREETVPDEKLTVTDTTVTIASDSVELEDAIAAGGTIRFTVTTPNGSDSYEAEVQE